MKKMDQNKIRLLTRYVHDECTIEELRQVRLLLESGQSENEWNHVIGVAAPEYVDRSSADNHNFSSDQLHAYEFSRDLLNAFDRDRLLKRVLASAGISDNKQNLNITNRTAFGSVAGSRTFHELPMRFDNGGEIEQGNKRVNHRQITKMWYWILSAALVTIAVTSVWMYDANERSIEHLSFTEVRTLPGEQLLYEFPDGSTALLNDKSVLRFSEDFGSIERRVTLEGKAFFDIRTSESTPFIVLANEVEIRVLGTSFGVRAYHDDHEISVMVESGTVSVDGKNGQTRQLGRLHRGDQISLDRDTRTYRLNRVNPDDANAWKDGRMVFYDEPFGDIVRAVERRFNVTIEVADENIYRQRVTFKQNGDILEDVLKILSLVVGVEYEINGSRINMK